MTGPLSTPHAWNMVAPGYAQYNQEDFDYFAIRALRVAGLAASDRVLDVATGPGTLALLAAPVAARVDAIDFSEPMLETLRSRIVVRNLRNLFPVRGDGQALPYEDGGFDAAFSMFGLMFFPDRGAGLRELYRVLRPGGRAVVASWTPMGQIPHLASLFSALAAARPELAGPEPPPPVLATPAAVAEEMSQAGFTVRVVEVTNTWLAASMDTFLEAARAGFAPLCLIRERLGDAAFDEAWKRVGERMREAFGDGPVAFPMTALFGIGQRG
jgi:ubiquinone/menaquinone biosynthesis C-methylase UbiE